MNLIKITLLVVFFASLTVLDAHEVKSDISKKKIAYIVSDIRIPFWKIMSRGIKNSADELGYEVSFYGSNNIKKSEIQNTVKVIKDKVDAIILSPINSSSAVTVLKFAESANIPVVISDIGTDKGKYLSFISSDNEDGAYRIGQVLAKKMKELGWDKNGSVGIISIPQKRANGKARTAGFMKAMNESSIKVNGLKQQVNFSYKETYDFSIELIQEHKNLSAIWLQGSDRYKAALDAIKDAGKVDEVLLVVFDAEPEFLELIPKGVIIGAAMQQPYVFGEEAVLILDDFFNKKDVKKHIQLSILSISTDNIEKNIPIIKRNVLGILE
ncbi:substrate-binding domain-containing protein [Sulfurimonas sp.]|jgi:ribose transport system substrate-binding protein|uniref:substrate-binding domain-containing protein n=1 Tax=Sulfurimonas sp. TaxID=2022749 RepID=UPI0025F92B25|nr:substrate-binding domain-containing protein [Sulfurimonas sp.]MCK9473912.1 substrate-binding domain-containing protein [Sulfurimonas sp.]MDD3505164.1 substrate-binding domain-containing protein [Sulfurimonas sp.]